MASWKKVIVSGSAAELASLTLDTDLALSHGGTGASTAAAARTNLGLVKGISDGNVLAANDVVVDNDFLRINGTEVEGRSASEVRSDLGIEAGATADQSNAEIVAAVEAGTDSNTFTNADHTKLNAIEASATADQTADEIGVLFKADNTTAQFGGAVSASSLNTATTITIAGGSFTSASLAAAVAGVYTHPSYDGDDISVDTTALTGATIISDLDFNITTDATGHVTDANGTVGTRTLTLANLGYTGDTDAKNHQTGAEIATALNADLGGNVSFGNQTSDSVTFAGPVVVTGNLTVNGTTTTIATANLTVEDQFVVLNDGGSAADGGIVIEGAGTALGWDESESRWGVEHDGAAEGDTALDPDAYISCVVTSDLSNYQKNGNIKISSGDIYIYVE